MLPFPPRHTLINHDVKNVYVCIFCKLLRCCKCVYLVRHRDVLLCILCLGDIGSLPHVSIHMCLTMVYFHRLKVHVIISIIIKSATA